MWVCLIWWMGCGLLNFIIDLVDLGCGFVPVVGLFDLVDVRCWMWVCASDGCGFVPISLDVFFFFFFF